MSHRLMTPSIVCLVSTLLLLAPDQAAASGVAKKVTLAQAVARARHVLVVETAKPLRRIVKKQHPYVDRKTKQKKVLELQHIRFRFRVLRRLGPPPKDPKDPGPRVGSVIEVLDGNALLGEAVHISMVTTGNWPIPYYPQIAGQVALGKPGRYVLLLNAYEPQEKRYQGIAGPGLLPVSREAEVRRLLAKPKKH